MRPGSYIVLSLNSRLERNKEEETWGAEGLAEVAVVGARLARQEGHGEVRCHERLGRVAPAAVKSRIKSRLEIEPCNLGAVNFQGVPPDNASRSRLDMVHVAPYRTLLNPTTICLAEMWSGSEEGSYVRLIECCIT